MYKLLFTLSLVSAQLIADTNEILRIERSVAHDVRISFPNDDNIRPKKSDFELNSYVLMSNDEGERVAVVTLTNLTSGSREFEHTHLMALFADGQRFSPIAYKAHFKPNQTQSLTLSFGINKFPILSLYTHN